MQGISRWVLFQHLPNTNVPFISEASKILNTLDFLGLPLWQAKTFFIMVITILEASCLCFFCLPEGASLCQTLHLFLLNFILLVPAQLFRLSKQFHILVVGSILLVRPPSCIIHKFESMSSTRKLMKCWWSPAKRRVLSNIPRMSHFK